MTVLYLEVALRCNVWLGWIYYRFNIVDLVPYPFKSIPRLL
jgi:hypothetical protein